MRAEREKKRREGEDRQSNEREGGTGEGEVSRMRERPWGEETGERDRQEERERERKVRSKFTCQPHPGSGSRCEKAQSSVCYAGDRSVDQA